MERCPPSEKRSFTACDEIVGADPTLRATVDHAIRVAPTRIPVLISGESGTGKELVARLIHQNGSTPRGPFVPVNCGTLPRELADSELFGHERGAFTGAGARKTGWFEQAHGGTLVLDEIGELPLDLQPKLLRVLETGRFRRVGGAGEVAVTVRVVAMTLRHLQREVERGAFRMDLYHRLAGFELVLPPLRNRRHDIPLLVERILAEFASEGGARHIDADAMVQLMRHDWPGNVRELRNVLRRAGIFCADHIDASSLELASTGLNPPAHIEPPRLADCEQTVSLWPSAPSLQSARNDALAPRAPDGDLLSLTGRTFAQIERAVLGWALHQNGGSRRRAARALALPRSSLCDKVKRYGLAPARNQDVG
jgi:DNA-binding NtrC family response regulator